MSQYQKISHIDEFKQKKKNQEFLNSIDGQTLLQMINDMQSIQLNKDFLVDENKIEYNDLNSIKYSIKQIIEYLDIASAGQEKGDIPMDWQQKYFDQLESELKETKNSILRVENSINSKVDQQTNRIQEFLSNHISEIRHLDNQRKQDVDNMNARLDNQNKWLIGLIITTIIGIAAMVVTVVLNK